MNISLGFFIFIYFVINCCYGQNSSDTSVVLEDGASLLRMGNLFDNPLLRMLGKVFIHTEKLVGEAKDEIFEDLCDLHPCSPWSEWSGCSAEESDSYGIQTRKRRCGVDSPFCIQPRSRDEEPTNEQGTRICEGGCPTNFTLSSNGFCLQFFLNSVNKYKADEICAENEAFVVHINSKAKSDAVHELLAKKGITRETIWIDGRRAGRYSSTWTFQYESETGWTNWYSGQPGNYQYCRVEENYPRKWFDRDCGGNYYFVCEYPKRESKE